MDFVIFSLVIFAIIFAIFLLVLKFDIFNIRHCILRIVVPAISTKIRRGIIKYDKVNWCTLPLNTYDDNGSIPYGIMDITHPSIVYIQDSWNGYTHWLAATPYPQSLPTAGAKYENTCLFFANQSNGITHPKIFLPILKNPIVFIGDAQYNSDPDLFYNTENSKLYCITRKRNGSDYVTQIVLQHSVNGQNWSAPLPIITIKDKSEFLSPCLIKFRDKYRIYAFQTDSHNKSISNSIDIWESASIIDPNFHFYKSIKWKAPMNIWHGGLFEFKNDFYLIFCGTHKSYNYLTGNKDSSKYLFLGSTKDGENFRFFDTPILKMNGVYRSSAFVDKNENLICYISMHNRYHGEEQYKSGHRIGMFEYPIVKLLTELSSKRDNSDK